MARKKVITLPRQRARDKYTKEAIKEANRKLALQREPRDAKR